MQKKPNNRMEPAGEHRVIEGKDHVYVDKNVQTLKQEPEKLQIGSFFADPASMKQLDKTSRDKIYRILKHDYDFSQDQIDEIETKLRNS